MSKKDAETSTPVHARGSLVHEETSEGIQAVLQELEDIADKLRLKVDHVLTPSTNLHIYFKGQLLAYDAAVKAVRELQPATG